ncbi:MAG TPA: peptidase U62, partial [Verrucomicrobiae bacterium]|nr:peptidase U62 [Verrucomicrobiae bacterium]
MRRFALIFFLVILGCPFIAFADGPVTPQKSSISSDDHGDPMLKAMLAELKRSEQELRLGDMQRPYYIDYQVTDLQDYVADASLGALRSDTSNIGRLVRVVVRIGDYKQDSYYAEG